MKRNWIVSVSVVVVAVLLLHFVALRVTASTTSASSSYGSKVVEYKVVQMDKGTVSQRNLQAIFDSAGKQGWNLVAFPDYGLCYYAIFKR